MIVRVLKKKWGLMSLVVLVVLSLGMTKPRAVKRYSLPFDFHVGYGPYAQTEGPYRALQFSPKDGTFRCVTLAEGDKHYYQFYCDTTSSNPQVFVVYGNEEDPQSQYVKFDGYPLIEVASRWGDGADYEYSFSDIDEVGIRYYYVTGYYHLDTLADTILHLPPHEDTIVGFYQWKDLTPEKCYCDN